MNTLHEAETFPDLQDIDTGKLVPDEEMFRASLFCLDTMDDLRFSVLLKDSWTEASVILEGSIPERQLPKFLVHSDYFVNGTTAPEDSWRDAIAEAITRFSRPKLILRKKGGFLKVTLSIGKVKLSGKILWKKAAKLFED